MTRPLYLQVHDALLERITGGEWGPGTSLPNELDLSREYGVSTGTMRKALEVMEGERLIARHQGRGTFVIDQTSDELAVRFSNVRDANGVPIAGLAEVIAATEGVADEQECARLQLGAQDAVYRFRCVRRHAGTPYMVERISVPAALFPDLLRNNGHAHDISALAQSHGMLLGKAEERISVQPAPPEVAEVLLVDPSSPLIVLDRLMQTLDGRRIEWRVGQCHLAENYYLAQIS